MQRFHQSVVPLKSSSSENMEDCKFELQRQDCLTVLKNYLNADKYEFVSYELQPLSPTKEGFLGDHYILNISYKHQEKKQTQSFFLKTMDCSSKVIFELTKSLNAYEKEELFYTVLLPAFQKYDIDISFVPISYLCKPYFIVLENLRTAGYKGIPKKMWLDLEHCKVSLKSLAKFHTAGILYEQRESKERGNKYKLDDQYPELLKDVIFAGDENPAALFFKSSLEGIFQLISLIAENGVSKTAFAEKLEGAVSEILSADNELDQIRKTLLHGDLWSNNFLYCYQDKSPVSSKLLDFQIIKYGPPSLDVLGFLYTNTRKQFRQEFAEDLLEYYYTTFGDILASKGMDISEVLPKEEFRSVCEGVKIAAKLQAIADRCITFLSDDTFTDIYKSDEELSAFIFESRAKHIVQAFSENEVFRELITEDMLELRSMVCGKDA